MSTPNDDYQCSTQDGSLPAFDVRIVPKTKSDGKTSSLVIGSIDWNKNIAPRWNIKTQPDQKLLYYLRRETFQAEDKDELTVEQRAQFAADAMQQACDQWNQIGFGLSIVPTDDKSAANFYVVYLDPISPKWTAYASAFFPHQPGRDVVIYRKALLPAKRAALSNTLLHELGHALGLRHEFAITGDGQRLPEGEGAAQFMETNPRSVMSYSLPPTLQDSDRDGIKGFYALANGAQISEDVPVKDFTPWKRADYPEADERVRGLMKDYGAALAGVNTSTNPDPVSTNPPQNDTGGRPVGGGSRNGPQGTDPKGNPEDPPPIPTPAKPSVPVTTSTGKGTVDQPPADKGTKPSAGGAAPIPTTRPTVTGTATTVGGKVVVAPAAASKPVGAAVAPHQPGPATGSNPTSTGATSKPAPPSTSTKPPVKGAPGHS